VNKRVLLFILLPVLITFSGMWSLLHQCDEALFQGFQYYSLLVQKNSTVSAHKVQLPLFPFTTSRISAEWDTEDVNKVAREAGITTVYYADVHTLSFLLNTYKRSTLIIYGD